MQNGARVSWKMFFMGVLVGTGLTAGCACIYLALKSTGEAKSKRALASQCLGYKIWQDETRFKKNLILEDVLQGMRACAAQEKPPKDLSETELWQMIEELQQESFEQCAAENLLLAEKFLAQIAQKPHIHILTDKKLYYEVLAEGKGTWCVEPLSTEFFHYTIVDGKRDMLLDTRKDNIPKEVCLADVIPGFSKGVEGMKANERRKIYIHPDLAYRSTHWIAPPQSLLIVDVEAIK